MFIDLESRQDNSARRLRIKLGNKVIIHLLTLKVTIKV